MTIGPGYANSNACTFTVWAPEKEKVSLVIVYPAPRQIEMTRTADGYFAVTVDGVAPGTRYRYHTGDPDFYPDPASPYQPDGVHGPSAVVDHRSFHWGDACWRGLPFNDLVLYELHVGSFTPEGTFEAIIPRLDKLLEVGVNAIELMPVAQFPGDRNWGYDAVFPYAVQNSYGGPDGLKKLVDACHQKGIAVFLDVVYNHLGPEGNYFSAFGPYFTSRYCTPWGDAINYDEAWSDGVRDYFSGNMLYWFEHYHIDGLRCDAIHMVYDNGAVHFWEYCHQKVKETEQRLGRKLYLTAESDLNSPKVINHPSLGGYGFDAQWLDDFHHALYVLLDGEGRQRYEDFGHAEQLAKAYTDGFVHSGEYVTFRRRRHGRSSAAVPGNRFIAFNQNHDQVGNRVGGERLCILVDFERQKLAAAALLLSPYIPMLFMGEEYADQSPFYYFVSHSDPKLIAAVQQGRKEEFADLNGNAAPPDPQDEKTFAESKLQWHVRGDGKHKVMLEWVTMLIAFRRNHDVMREVSKYCIKATTIGTSVVVLLRQNESGTQHLLCLLNFGEQPVKYQFSAVGDTWEKLLDSKDTQWAEDGHSVWEPMLPHATVPGETVTVPGLGVAVYASR